MTVLAQSLLNWSGWTWPGWTAVEILVLALTLLFLVRYTKATLGLLQQAKRQTDMMESDRKPFLVLLFDPNYAPSQHPLFPGALVIRNDGGALALDVTIRGLAGGDFRIPVVSKGGQSVIWLKRMSGDLQQLVSPRTNVELSYHTLGGELMVRTWSYRPDVKDSFVLVSMADSDL